MSKSVTKIQDKDTNKRLSVVESTECPGKYGVVILNPDGSKIGWDSVSGPSSSIDGDVVLFDGTNGKKIKDSGKKLGDATIIIQRNSCDVGCFTTNQESNSCINISVPTQACEVGALPDSTKYGANLDMSINSCNYCLTMQLKDQNGCNLGNACSVDLPIESMVVNACYLCDTKEIELILQNGCCICFGVGDLVCGLQSEITANNKIGSDCVSDTGQCNKFVTETEKCCINTALQGGDNISCLCNDCGYISGISCNDVTTALGYSPAQCCDIPTNNCQLCNGCGYIKGINCGDVTTALGYTPYNSTNPCGYTSCTGTVVANDLIPYAKSCDLCSVATSGKYCDLSGTPTLCTVATSGKYCDLSGKPTIPTDNCELANGCGYTTCTGTLVPSDLNGYAKSCDLCSVATSGLYCDLSGRVTDNCQIANSCGYVKSTDLCAVATSGKYCDLSGQPTIPTDNCQLANSCGYTTCTGTVSSCSDIISKLGYTPYNSTNPCGYTTCTGTLVAGDLNGYAKSCDLCAVATSGKYCDLSGTPTIPTDNCQLSNGCGYITGIDSGDVTTALGYTPADSANLGTAAACDTGTGSGDVPVLDSNGKLATSTLPGVALTDTFTVSTSADLTTLSSADQGDIAIVTSENKTYVLSVAPYSTAANWKQILSPTGGVTSVNGQTGAVCINVPTDNCELSNGCGYTTCTGTVTSSDLACYAQCCDMVCSLTGADNSHYPSAKAVADALSCAGAGDMLASTYDPCNCSTDAFNYNNMYNKPTIPTDNCQLANSCGYITISSVPTDNCQLSNGCGYITNSALSGYALSCDIPTNNCQLTNGCGYTTCTGTLVASDIACINGCCLTNGGNVCLNDTLSVTLTTAGWSGGTQTVTATGVTSSNTVITSPAPTSISDYVDAGIYASAQGTNSLTFTSDTTPSNNITVNVVILN